MRRLGQHSRYRPAFDNLPGIHHQHMRGVLGNHRQIMGDQQQGHARIRDQAGNQIEDLRLRRYIQRRCRLISNQQFRAAGQRHGNHRPLSLAARQLMRVAFRAALCVRQADALHQDDGLLTGRNPSEAAMQAQRLGYLGTNAV